MAVDYQSGRPRLATITGGYSGPPIKPVALAKVWEAYQVVHIPIIGIGGIVSWQDVIEFFIVGASAVQIGTGLYADPQLPEKMNNGLSNFLKQKKIENISQLTGSLRVNEPFIVGAPI